MSLAKIKQIFWTSCTAPEYTYTLITKSNFFYFILLVTGPNNILGLSCPQTICLKYNKDIVYC